MFIKNRVVYSVNFWDRNEVCCLLRVNIFKNLWIVFFKYYMDRLKLSNLWFDEVKINN